MEAERIAIQLRMMKSIDQTIKGNRLGAADGSSSREACYNHKRWESIGELMEDLICDMTPRPFWIKFGRYATKVTDENKDSLARSLHLAMEFQMARDEQNTKESGHAD